MLKHPLLFVWIILIGAFVGIGLLRPAGDMQKVADPNTKSQHAQAQSSNPGRPWEQPDADHYTTDCSKPKEHKDADFCQQVRMADAAWHQVRIGWWGLALVLGTLIATAVAAKAAWQTVRTMDAAAKQQLRAYVGIDHVSVEENGHHPRVRLHLKNFGLTPAGNVLGAVNLLWETGKAADMRTKVVFDERAALRRAPFPIFGGQMRGTSFPIDSGRWTSVRAQTETLFVFTRITYTDIHGKAQETEAMFRCITHDGGKHFGFEDYDDYAEAT